MRSSSLSLFALVALLVQASIAANWFVSPSGDNTNDGQSVDSPFQTLQKAWDTASQFDTVNLAGGEYPEHSSLTKAVNIIGPHPSTGQRAVITGAPVKPNTLLPFILVVKGQTRASSLNFTGITWQDFEIEGAFNNSDGLLRMRHASLVTVNGFYFTRVTFRVLETGYHNNTEGIVELCNGGICDVSGAGFLFNGCTWEAHGWVSYRNFLWLDLSIRGDNGRGPTSFLNQVVTSWGNEPWHAGSAKLNIFGDATDLQIVNNHCSNGGTYYITHAENVILKDSIFEDSAVTYNWLNGTIQNVTFVNGTYAVKVENFWHDAQSSRLRSASVEEDIINIAITDCTFEDILYAIAIVKWVSTSVPTPDSLGVTATSNDFSKMAPGGSVVFSPTFTDLPLAASFNFWGSTAGPSDECNPLGNGTSVGGSAVSYRPWCVNLACTETGTAPVPDSCIVHSSDKVLGGGAIAGIVIGCFAFVMVGAILAVLLVTRRRRQQRQDSHKPSEDEAAVLAGEKNYGTMQKNEETEEEAPKVAESPRSKASTPRQATPTPPPEFKAPTPRDPSPRPEGEKLPPINRTRSFASPSSEKSDSSSSEEEELSRPAVNHSGSPGPKSNDSRQGTPRHSSWAPAHEERRPSIATGPPPVLTLPVGSTPSKNPSEEERDVRPTRPFGANLAHQNQAAHVIQAAWRKHMLVNDVKLNEDIKDILQDISTALGTVDDSDDEILQKR